MDSHNKYDALLGNTFLISLGTFGSKLLTFVMVRFYTGVLTPADYGTADLIMQTCNLLLPVVSLGITNGVFRFALEQQAQRRSIFSAGLYTIFFGGAVLLAAVPMLPDLAGMRTYSALICGYTITSCLHSLCAQYIRAEGKTALFAGQGILNTALVISFNLLLLIPCRLGIVGYVLSVALADGVCAGYLVIREKLWQLLTLRPDRKLFRQMLRYSLPLIPTTIFWWITGVSDRYMVADALGTDAAGLYAVACKIPTILTLLSTVFLEAWQFSAISESGGKQQDYIEFFSRVWGAFLAVMCLAGGVIIALCRVEIRLLSAPRFYSAWEYIPTLTLAMIFSAFASFMGSVYVVTKRSIASFRTALWGALTNIVLNLLLIPLLGIQGAAIATLESYLLCFAIRAVSARRMIPFRFCIGRMLGSAAVLAAQTALCFCTHPLQPVGQGLCLLLLLALNYRPLPAVGAKIIHLLKNRSNKT